MCVCEKVCVAGWQNYTCGHRNYEKEKSPQDRVNSQAEVAPEQKHMAAPGIIKILFPVPQSPAETKVSSQRQSGFCQTANL